ncbi:RNA polymerase sigma factor [Aliidiomarina halalkaliphila]|uniref:RNA polymerase sigma factor n=1 Tax=Aliidiomarina halalkaliphila TaxID=2593535 RepID=A0A552X4M6_9GAMM|nr:RNA polymerase sigma factor [Aliidiomarina halalkaliphila]TRW49869.1 RNA polymerase sigma factor [Aliidiomarina halalkaliphila]
MSASSRRKAELASLLPPLRRFAFSLTTSMPDADDLVQQTVERILTRPVPDDVELLKWAFRVCRNLWIDDYRARRVRENATFDTDLQQAQQVNGTDVIETEMELNHVGEAMKRLPADQHEVLAMIAVQGMSYRETAESLNIPIGTVMSRLARARSALAQQLYGTEKELH